jgi:hypothetical protein
MGMAAARFSPRRIGSLVVGMGIATVPFALLAPAGGRPPLRGRKQAALAGTPAT